MTLRLPHGTGIRRATGDDAATLADHRVGMFRDMNAIEAGAEPAMIEASRRYFSEAVPRGEYVGWVMYAADDDRHILGGAGALIRTLLPRPDSDKRRLVVGWEALVLNVYVVPEWRRRGLARYLMETVLEWARVAHMARVVLHASGDGRPLYESMGFVPTGELRYTGDLTA